MVARQIMDQRLDLTQRYLIGMIHPLIPEKAVKDIAGREITNNRLHSFIFADDGSGKPADLFVDEYNLAIELGFEVALLDLDALCSGKIKLNVKHPGLAVYRGWMLSEKEYNKLEKAILPNAHLINSPENYIKAHHITGWLDTCRDLTAPTVLCAGLSAIETAIKDTGWKEFFVKDFVKSAPSPYSSIASDVGGIVNIVKQIESSRGVIEGGICIRKREHYKTETEERYFVYGGRIFARHNRMDIPDIVEEVASRFNTNFYSIDVVENTDGVLRLVEIGDGQVSGIKNWDVKQFMRIFR